MKSTFKRIILLSASITALVFGTIAANAPALPDMVVRVCTVTGRPGFTKTVTCGEKITVLKTDAVQVVNGKYLFNLDYTIVNIGTAPSGIFKNSIVPVSVLVPQPMASINAGASAHVACRQFLSLGLNTIRLRLDDPPAVAESNEANNICTIFIVVV